MEIQNEFKKAINFFQKGNYNEAKKIYEQILVEKSDFPEIHYNLGIVLKILNNLEEAEKSFERAISLKSDFVHAHYHMGNTKYKLKKFDESEFSYKKAISLNSKFTEAYINLSRAQRELGRLSEAEENARIALKLNPDLADANNQLSLILFDRGRLSDDLKYKDLEKLNEAKTIILRAIDLNSNYALSYLNYGLILQELGDLNGSKDALQKSLNIDPNSFLAKYNLDILIKQIDLLNKIGLDLNTDNFIDSNFKKKFSKNPFIANRNPSKDLINLLYKINSTELNKTKGGPLYGNGKTSDYQIFDNDNPILNDVKNDIIKIIKDEIKANVFIIDSFFNILGAGGGSVPHHHLNSIDKNFKLDQQKYSLTYYLDVGDQSCNEPGYFVMEDPEEKVLPSNGMIMVIPASRKHSAVYNGKSDRIMIGVNFYCY
jgi:tetratricopeptide (TPR) repeat protein